LGKFSCIVGGETCVWWREGADHAKNSGGSGKSFIEVKDGVRRVGEPVSQLSNVLFGF
jgi:hypothetical protein